MNKIIMYILVFAFCTMKPVKVIHPRPPSQGAQALGEAIGVLVGLGIGAGIYWLTKKTDQHKSKYLRNTAQDKKMKKVQLPDSPKKMIQEEPKPKESKQNQSKGPFKPLLVWCILGALLIFLVPLWMNYQ